MNDAQLAAFELRLAELRKFANSDHSLAGCLLAACSAHDPAPKRQLAMIRFLVKSGVSINETDKNGVTPLHRAVRFRSLEAVKLLLELGADVNAADRRSHSTPLHRAMTNTGAPATAGKQHLAAHIAEVLLSHGARSDVKNKKGKAPIDYANSEEMKQVFNL